MDLTTHWNGFDITVQTVSASERCAICTNRTAGSMLAFHERPGQSITQLECKTWLLCADCAAAVVTEVERSALRTPLRLRIALGVVAAERRPERRLTPLDTDYWELLPEERVNKLVIGFMLAMFALPLLVFVLVMALTLSGVPHP